MSAGLILSSESDPRTEPAIRRFTSEHDTIENAKYDPSLPLAFKIAELFELSIDGILQPH